jgi:tartrate-resistant acid phosphatase type 5
LAFVHYPPYKSDGVTNTQSPSGSVPLRLAYGDWGADAVFSGDSHVYERILAPSKTTTTTYFINGLGGAGLGRFPRDTNGQLLPAIPGSQFRFDADYGAMWVEADPCRITYSLLKLDGTVVDSLTQTRNCQQPTPTLTQTPTPISTHTPTPISTPGHTPTPSPTVTSSPVPTATSTVVATPSQQPGMLPRAYVPFVLRY